MCPAQFTKVVPGLSLEMQVFRLHPSWGTSDLGRGALWEIPVSWVSELPVYGLPVSHSCHSNIRSPGSKIAVTYHVAEKQTFSCKGLGQKNDFLHVLRDFKLVGTFGNIMGSCVS